jgi:hypothetical protein
MKAVVAVETAGGAVASGAGVGDRGARLAGDAAVIDVAARDAAETGAGMIIGAAHRTAHSGVADRLAVLHLRANVGAHAAVLDVLVEVDAG